MIYKHRIDIVVAYCSCSWFLCRKWYLKQQTSSPSTKSLWQTCELRWSEHYANLKLIGLTLCCFYGWLVFLCTDSSRRSNSWIFFSKDNLSCSPGRQSVDVKRMTNAKRRSSSERPQTVELVQLQVESFSWILVHFKVYHIPCLYLVLSI